MVKRWDNNEIIYPLFALNNADLKEGISHRFLKEYTFKITTFKFDLIANSKNLACVLDIEDVEEGISHRFLKDYIFNIITFKPNLIANSKNLSCVLIFWKFY